MQDTIAKFKEEKRADSKKKCHEIFRDLENGLISIEQAQISVSNYWLSQIPSLLTLLEEQFEGKFIEEGADLEHERWAKWQRYMHSKIEPTEHDPLMHIGTEWVERWNRQIATPYSALSEKEKESDRIEVRKYLPLIRKILSLAKQQF